jgi:hypothetical protein
VHAERNHSGHSDEHYNAAETVTEQQPADREHPGHAGQPHGAVVRAACCPVTSHACVTTCLRCRVLQLYSNRLDGTIPDSFSRLLQLSYAQALCTMLSRCVLCRNSVLFVCVQRSGPQRQSSLRRNPKRNRGADQAHVRTRAVRVRGACSYHLQYATSLIARYLAFSANQLNGTISSSLGALARLQ